MKQYRNEWKNLGGSEIKTGVNKRTSHTLSPDRFHTMDAFAESWGK